VCILSVVVSIIVLQCSDASLLATARARRKALPPFLLFMNVLMLCETIFKNFSTEKSASAHQIREKKRERERKTERKEAIALEHA
jgi:hypothetical protein